MFAPPRAGIRRLGRLVSQNPVACAYPTAVLVGAQEEVWEVKRQSLGTSSTIRFYIDDEADYKNASGDSQYEGSRVRSRTRRIR